MKEGPLLFNIPDVPAHVTYAVVASGILIGLAIATRLTLKKKDAPTGFQNFMEVLIGGLEDFVVEIMSPEGRHYFTLIAGLFLFILVGNLLGLLPGFDSPTGNLNTTLALALVSFTAKHFMGPMWALAPIMFIIEVISHLARVLSLSFRLFGNMVAKHKLLLVLALLSPYIAPIPILGLGLLVAVVQAGVFTLLTMLYLSGSIEQAHIGGADHH